MVSALCGSARAEDGGGSARRDAQSRAETHCEGGQGAHAHREGGSARRDGLWGLGSKEQATRACDPD